MPVYEKCANGGGCELEYATKTRPVKVQKGHLIPGGEEYWTETHTESYVVAKAVPSKDAPCEKHSDEKRTCACYVVEVTRIVDQTKKKERVSERIRGAGGVEVEVPKNNGRQEWINEKDGVYVLTLLEALCLVDADDGSGR